LFTTKDEVIYREKTAKNILSSNLIDHSDGNYILRPEKHEFTSPAIIKLSRSYRATSGI